MRVSWEFGRGGREGVMIEWREEIEESKIGYYMNKLYAKSII